MAPQTIGNLKRARAWYGGKQPPATDVLDLVEMKDSGTQLLYLLDANGESGDYLPLVQSLRGKLHTPDLFATWSPEKTYLQFFKALLYFTSSLKERVQVLMALGAFPLASSSSLQEFKEQFERFFAPLASSYDALTVETLARQLPSIWSPHSQSLLDYLLYQPTMFGKILAHRLDPAEAHGLKIIGHAFADIDSIVRQKIGQSQTVAYERRGEIHFNMAVRQTLDEWEADPEIGQNVTQEIDLLETLLLHELVEIVLDETADLDPLPAHIVASTFERCLKDSILAMAVEVFFIDWQPVADHLDETPTDEAEPHSNETSIDDLFSPPAPSKPTAPANLSRHYATEALGDPSGKSVIVIDDSAMIRKIVSDTVVKLGHNIREASDGRIGVVLVKTHKPDLIILDVVMAEKGGIETLKELRSDPNFKTTPIIMLTTEASQHIIREAMTWRVNDYLVKPIGSKKLRQRIAAQLDRR